MAKQKTIPQLEAEKAENERKLSQLQHKKQQLENRAVYYEKGDRRKRAHRLITRGAAIESVAPLAKILTETEFYAFAEKALALPEVKGLLRLYGELQDLYPLHLGQKAAGNAHRETGRLSKHP